MTEPTEPTLRPAGRPLDPDTAALAAVGVRALSATKAHDVRVYDVTGRASYCDLIVVASAQSGRQVRAAANRVLSELRGAGRKRPRGVEGMEASRWVLVDLGDVLLHVFLEESRATIDLDGLWAEARRVPFAELGLNAHGLEGDAVPTPDAQPAGWDDEDWGDDDWADDEWAAPSAAATEADTFDFEAFDEGDEGSDSDDWSEGGAEE